jgi:hypothetical protein
MTEHANWKDYGDEKSTGKSLSRVGLSSATSTFTWSHSVHVCNPAVMGIGISAACLFQFLAYVK